MWRVEWQKRKTQCMLQLVGQRSLFSNVRTLLLPVSLIRPYQYLPYCCHSVDFGAWTAILCTFLTLPSKKSSREITEWYYPTPPQQTRHSLSKFPFVACEEFFCSSSKNLLGVFPYQIRKYLWKIFPFDLQQDEQGDNDNLQFSLRVLGFIGLCSATSVLVLGSPRLT